MPSRWDVDDLPAHTLPRPVVHCDARRLRIAGRRSGGSGPSAAAPLDRVRRSCRFHSQRAERARLRHHRGRRYDHRRRVFANVSEPGGPAMPRTNLLAFDANTGAISDGFAPMLNDIVRGLATEGTSIFVGGDSWKVNGTQAVRPAKLDLTGHNVPGFKRPSPAPASTTWSTPTTCCTWPVRSPPSTASPETAWLRSIPSPATSSPTWTSPSRDCTTAAPRGLSSSTCRPTARRWSLWAPSRPSRASRESRPRSLISPVGRRAYPIGAPRGSPVNARSSSTRTSEKSTSPPTGPTSSWRPRAPSTVEPTPGSCATADDAASPSPYRNSGSSAAA